MKERKIDATASAQSGSRAGANHAGRVGATDTPRQRAQDVRIAQLRKPVAQANRTGLPDRLKSGIEALSGLDMSGVRVHRNSSKPAAMQAHAYAQGSDIHLGPGQDKHLAHEAWHVVQQRQGRVQATTAAGGVGVNDSPTLEREADRMGVQALQAKPSSSESSHTSNDAEVVSPIQRQSEAIQAAAMTGGGSSVAQRMPYEEVRAGCFYRVQTVSGERVLYLREKRHKPKVEFVFYAGDQRQDFAHGPAAVINDESRVLSVSKPPVRLPAADYGSYAQDQEPWYRLTPQDSSKAEATPSLAERLDELQPRIESEWLSRLSPDFWSETGMALDASSRFEPPTSKRAQTDVPAKRHVGRNTARTPQEIGEEFVTQYAPQPIAGTEPSIVPVKAKSAPPSEAGSVANHRAKRPGFLLNVPVHTSKSVNAILTKYGEEASRGLADGNRRVAAVVAVNARRSLDADTAVEQQLERTDVKPGFPYTAVGFYWAPQFGKEWGKVDFEGMKAEYSKLETEAQNYVKRHLYDGASGQDYLPYGLFREQALCSEATSTLTDHLQKYCDPVYVHVGDPDALSWTVNNDDRTGVLARFEEVLDELGLRDEGKAAFPPLLVGGYNFGKPSASDDTTTRLVKLGNIADRALRRTVAATTPEVLYPTEPNLLVKMSDSREPAYAEGFNKLLKSGQENPGAVFGKGAAEGQELRSRMAKALKRSIADPMFAPYVDATIETEIPPRIASSATAHPKEPILNLLEQKQSYLTTSNWTSISRTDYAEVTAKGKVHKAIRAAVETSIARDKSGKDVADEFAVWKQNAEKLFSAATNSSIEDLLGDAPYQESFSEGVRPEEFVQQLLQELRSVDPRHFF